MRSLWLAIPGIALAACRGDWVPPVADGTYQVTAAALPSADGEWMKDSVVFDDQGHEYNQLGQALQLLSGELAVPMPTVSLDVQLAIKDEAVTLVNAGQVGARLPFEAHNNDAFASGGAVTVDLTFAGYDPVPLAVTEAGVLLDPVSVQGALGGLVALDDVKTKLIPIASDIMNKIVARDCTLQPTAMSACGCKAGTDGAALEGIIATGCTVTADTFQSSSLLASLIAPYPDGFLTLGLAMTTARQ